MKHEFESLESAHGFVTLLAETVDEAKRELEADVQRESAPSRRLDALRIAQYNLIKLEVHVAQTSRLLNDLRTLRRLLFEERRVSGFAATSVSPRQPHGDGDKPSLRLNDTVAA